MLSSPEKKSLRDGFGAGLLEEGSRNSKVVVLTADLADSTRVHLFQKKFPDRFVECGVAEQNMACIAAGLARSGKIPFATSFGAFSPGRNWDQIRVSVCYANANVKLVGSHGGFSNGPDGATHQALEDIALARVLPNMTVLAPCDYWEAVKVVAAAAKVHGPVYIRLAKEPTPILTKPEGEFVVGRATKMRDGKDVAVISYGPILSEVLAAADLLAQHHKIDVEVLNFHTIKPLDKESILAAAQKTANVVVVEEHQQAGGLGEAVAGVLAEAGQTVGRTASKFRIIAVKDSFGESGAYRELLKKHKLDCEAIAEEVTDLIA